MYNGVLLSTLRCMATVNIDESRILGSGLYLAGSGVKFLVFAAFGTYSQGTLWWFLDLGTFYPSVVSRNFRS